MALNDIQFTKQNGGMGRTSANEDPISGLILGLEDVITSPTTVFQNFEAMMVGEIKLWVATLTYYEQLANDYGIVRTNKEELTSDQQKAMNFIDYHVREFFHYSKNGTLYLAIKQVGEVLPTEITALQNYAAGTIRQVGIGVAAETAITSEQVKAYQEEANALANNHMPLSILVAQRKGEYTSVADLKKANFINKSLSNLSVVVAQDLALQEDMLVENKHLHEVACVGTLLGCVSQAAVHESIAWVQKFPLTMVNPGLITGEMLKEVSTLVLNELNSLHYLFVRKHIGISYVYWNDSHTLDEANSDYAYIENVRTMDKATRGIRANLLPFLGAPLNVKAGTGELREDSLALLETEASKALEDMERAGELSGYTAMIDPKQNVLATSEVEIIIKNVPQGVMRCVKVKIGFTTKLS